MRNIQFANDECYHIYNRGVEKRDVFLEPQEYHRFLLAMRLLNDTKDGLMIGWRDYKKANPKAILDDFLKPGFRSKEPLVEVIAYCLNPNHYHLILKQISDRGVERFMHKLGTSYTKYFNKKNKRNGVLFQGKFKAIHIDSNEYLLYLSVYINGNNFIHGYNDKIDWPYSSCEHYIKGGSSIVSSDIILGQFNNNKEYFEFLNDNIDYCKENKEFAKYLIED